MSVASIGANVGGAAKDNSSSKSSVAAAAKVGAAASSSAKPVSSPAPKATPANSVSSVAKNVGGSADTGTPNKGNGNSSGVSAAANVGSSGSDSGTPNKGGSSGNNSGGVNAAAQQERSTLGGRANSTGDATTYSQLDDWLNDTTIPVRTASQIKADLTRAQHPGADFVPEGAYLDPMAQGMHPAIALTGPGGLAAIAHSLNGPYLKRVEQNQSVAPFEGPVDTAGIVRALNAPYYRAHSTPGPMDPLGSSQTWRQMQDYLDNPNTNTSLGVGNTAPSGAIATKQPTLAQLQAMRTWNGSTGEHFDAPGVNPNAAPAPYTPSQELQTNAYLGEGNTPALVGIDAATSGGVPLPRRDPRGYGDIFATDGQVTTPDGTVLIPGAPAADVTVAPKLSKWDNVVDNTGKLLSHTGLGSIVSTLFPDQWNGMGNAFKGLDNGGGGGQPIDNTAFANLINGSGGDPFMPQRHGDSGGGGAPVAQAAVAAAFPDVNHNGIDDRLEGLDATGYGGNQYRSNRYATFPDMPPYKPGVDNEWNYFHDHLARGGVVGYADGGQVALAGPDPRVMAIADAEDALHAGRADDPAVAKFVSLFGSSALTQLQGHVGAGYSMRPRVQGARQITGPGGPTDDAIPAVIDGVHPAKLSSGEFVLPVSAVEGIGGGDPKVGADRLHALVARFAQ